MFRARQKVGKYRIVRRLAQGGFADVYEARDTVEGISVALKVPQAHFVTRESLADFRKEAQLAARLDHPNIVPLKTAGHVDGHFIVVYPLGEQTLADRLGRRLSTKLGLDYAGQMLAAVAHAHRQHVVHCDLKPENFLLFPENRLRLTDFGIAKVARRTIIASGSGTVGYLAPEQAMGRPTLRSDVFSLGLVLYRMFAGVLPEWPYEWPAPGHDRLRRRLPEVMIALIRKAMEVDERRRFVDAGQMLAVFERVRPRALAHGQRRVRRRRGKSAGPDWRQVRMRQFRRVHGRELALTQACSRCAGPVSTPMIRCPWCGADRKRQPRVADDFPASCPRCRRGVKLDWRFCAWCYGAAIGPVSPRNYTDRRYEARCSQSRCQGDLMPFMRYCPWCRSKVRRAWRIAGSRDRCGGCGWGVANEYWAWCPWCGRARPKSSTHGR